MSGNKEMGNNIISLNLLMAIFAITNNGYKFMAKQ